MKSSPRFERWGVQGLGPSAETPQVRKDKGKAAPVCGDRSGLRVQGLGFRGFKLASRGFKRRGKEEGARANPHKEYGSDPRHVLLLIPHIPVFSQ